MSNLNEVKAEFIKKATLSSGFRAAVGAATAGYSGFMLTVEMADELAKYMEKGNRYLALHAIRDGIILGNFGYDFKALTDKEIEDMIHEKFNKTLDEIGSIYKNLYKQIQKSNSRIISVSSKAGAMVGQAKNRLSDLIHRGLFGNRG